VINGAAGLIRTPWVRYSIAMLIGCVAWALIYATNGFAALDAATALATHSPWALVAVIVLLVAVAVAVFVARRRRRSAIPPDLPDLPEDATTR
jgi:membrane protein DedA with SNARE-associated domain